MDKKCRVCQETKPLTEYFKNVKSKDGHENRCKECYKKARPLKGPQTSEQRKQSQLKVSEKKKASLAKFHEENPNFNKVIAVSNRKAIVAVNTLDGSTLEFDSAVSAANVGFNKLSIYAAIRRKDSYKGYMWSYKNEG